MAKKMKFALKLDGNDVRTIEDFQDNFNITEVLDNFRSGTLEKWLDSRDYLEYLEKITKIKKDSDDKDVIKNIATIFDLDIDDSIIKNIENIKNNEVKNLSDTLKPNNIVNIKQSSTENNDINDNKKNENRDNDVLEILNDIKIKSDEVKEFIDKTINIRAKLDIYGEVIFKNCDITIYDKNFNKTDDVEVNEALKEFSSIYVKNGKIKFINSTIKNIKPKKKSFFSIFLYNSDIDINGCSIKESKRLIFALQSKIYVKATTIEKTIGFFACSDSYVMINNSKFLNNLIDEEKIKIEIEEDYEDKLDISFKISETVEDLGLGDTLFGIADSDTNISNCYFEGSDKMMSIAILTGNSSSKDILFEKCNFKNLVPFYQGGYFSEGGLITAENVTFEECVFNNCLCINIENLKFIKSSFDNKDVMNILDNIKIFGLNKNNISDFNLKKSVISGFNDIFFLKIIDNFYVEGSLFKNHFSEHGACLRGNSGDYTKIVKNSKFVDCKTNGTDGSTIYYSITDKNSEAIKLENCQFIRCKDKESVAVYSSGATYGIINKYYKSAIVQQNCNFEDCNFKE